MENNSETDRFLRRNQIIEMVGLSYATIHGMMNRGDFPQPRRVGKKAIGWLQSEVVEWIRSRPVADPKDCPSPLRKSDEPEE